MNEQRIIATTIALLGAATTAVGILKGLARFTEWQATPNRWRR